MHKNKKKLTLNIRLLIRISNSRVSHPSISIDSHPKLLDPVQNSLSA